MRPFVFILIVSTFFPGMFLLTACGGSSGSSGSSATTEDPEEGAEEENNTSINTAKLEGTPFEGMETGDDFDWDFFLCDDYRTETIDELPIKIFAAFFTASEEEIIQEGIDIASEAMGPTDDERGFYELTDIWADDVRVIYKVDAIIRDDGIEFDAYAHTKNVESRFNDKFYADTQMTDWRIEVIKNDSYNGINKWIIAHELGHASGIAGHYLIDYENDIFADLTEGELMDPGHSLSDPLIVEYVYMLEQQAQIITDHLSVLGSLGGETCSD